MYFKMVDLPNERKVIFFTNNLEGIVKVYGY